LKNVRKLCLIRCYGAIKGTQFGAAAGLIIEGVAGAVGGAIGGAAGYALFGWW